MFDDDLLPFPSTIWLIVYKLPTMRYLVTKFNLVLYIGAIKIDKFLWIHFHKIQLKKDAVHH